LGLIALPKKCRHKAQLSLCFPGDLAKIKGALEKNYNVLSPGKIPIGIARGMVAICVEEEVLISKEDKVKEAVNNLFKVWNGAL